jgi:hypothetical protein
MYLRTRGISENTNYIIGHGKPKLCDAMRFKWSK